MYSKDLLLDLVRVAKNAAEGGTEFYEGDEVYAQVPGGKFKGEFVEYDPDGVHGWIRNTTTKMKKRFPIADIKADTYESDVKQNLRNETERKRQEEERRKAEELRQKMENRPKPVIVPTTMASPATFVKYMEQVGYRLIARVRQPGDYERIKSEYSDWTGGLDMPDDCILREAFPEPGSFQRYWEIITLYHDDMPCNLPIYEAGSLGVGYGTKLQGYPEHGLRQGNRIYFRGEDTARTLIEAGLRARRSSK